MIQTFFKKYWAYVLPWALVVVFVVWVSILTHKPEATIQPPIKDNRIDSLEQVVNKLHTDLLKSRHDYDSARANVRTEIEYIRIKNAKEINDISSYSVDQRDSLWTTFNP